ncbi:hypothetical protein CVT26_015806, partial [Gymnopilus dilepis]
APTRIHDNKDIFEELVIREGWNIPKLHLASHYVNFNTEYTERLHIDLAKDAHEATNRKDEFSQMTIWLERKEKILRHQQYVDWKLEGSPQPIQREWLPPGLELHRKLIMAKHPSLRAIPINVIEEQYGAQYFCWALRRFIAARMFPDLNRAAYELHFRKSRSGTKYAINVPTSLRKSFPLLMQFTCVLLVRRVVSVPFQEDSTLPLSTMMFCTCAVELTATITP